MDPRDPRYQRVIQPPVDARRSPPPPMDRAPRPVIPPGTPSPLFRQAPPMPPPMQAPSYAPDLQAQPPPMRQSGEQERLIVQEQIEKAKPSMRKGEFPGGWIDKSGQLHRAV